jgi:hypothetical protein
MTDPKEWQLSNNAQSRDRWDSFAEHRKKVSELLRPHVVTNQSRLCILGAGNCQDLDLPSLLAVHGEVHLVDLDADSLAWGVAQQGVVDHPGVHLWGGVDVTGMLDAIASWSPQTSISSEDLSACADGPVRRVSPSLPTSFDLVASTCLLSQLIRDIIASVGERHPQFLGLIQAIRAGHLRLLAHLLSPGGTAVLITDIVSSETFPALGSVPESSLGALMIQLVRDRNFFHGLNPAVLSSLATLDPVLRTEVTLQESVPPWRWDFGPRLYLVCAVKFKK